MLRSELLVLLVQTSWPSCLDRSEPQFFFLDKLSISSNSLSCEAERVGQDDVTKVFFYVKQ